MKKLLFLCIIIVVALIAFFGVRGSGPFASESGGSSFTLAVATTDGGQVDVVIPGKDAESVDNPSEEQTFGCTPDTVIDLTAVPASGYFFVNWTGDVDTVGDSVEGDDVGTGDGSQTEWTLANSPALENSETICVDEAEQTRDTHYTIDYDTGQIEFATAPGDEAVITADYNHLDVTVATTTITMNGDYSVTANFAPVIDYSVSYTLTTDSTAGGVVVEPSDATNTYYGNTVVDLRALPDTGYSFINWTSEDETALAAIADVNAAETIITMTGDYSITATFGVYYTLTVASSTGGYVTSPDEAVSSYVAGTEVTLAATPDSDYYFLNWTGDDVSTVADVDAAETTITIDEDYSITANFVRWEVVYYNNDDVNDADQAGAMVMDDDGNVYVTGWSKGSGTDYDYLTIKYDSDLNQIWTARYDGPASSIDKAYDIAIDSNGNVYVTGESKGTTIRDYATVKYNSSGTQQWVARYDGSGNGWDAAKAVAVYEEGANVYIYVTGQSWTATQYDYATIRYRDNGGSATEEWSATYDGPANSADHATALAVDGSGNAHVTGYSDGGAGTNYDYATVKYNGSGVQQWATRYDGSAHLIDQASDIAVDGDGNVYVTGYSQSSSDEHDYATTKYNSAGTQQWASRYDGEAEDDDKASAIVLDGDGNVYVTGASEGNSTGYDYATIKYNATTGDEVWGSALRYNGDANLGDEASAIALDSDGNIYVTGNSYVVSNNCDYVTTKYDSDGNELWTTVYPIEGGDDKARAIAVDSDGFVYVTGYSDGRDTGDDYATIRITQ